MINNPRVTIVIPVYNGANYLAAAIESALSQTYDNLEIIVVNDGSTDGGATEAVAARYLSRVKYIAQENRGVAGALNAAVSQMSGDFFAWLSHDDIHLSHKTERQIAYHAKLGNPNASVFTDYYIIDGTGKIIDEMKWDHAYFVRCPRLSLLGGRINGCSLLVPRRVLHEFGPFDERLRFVQDYDLWNKIQTKYEFFHQPETLIKYRSHPEQGSLREEAIREGDDLWIRMMNCRSVCERAQISGSSKNFLVEMAHFLDEYTVYKRAVGFAREQASRAVSDSLVSVVLPFDDEIGPALKSAYSVLCQTHTNLELIMVHAGSTELSSAVRTMTRVDERVTVIAGGPSVIGAARDRGLHAARGSYIAFLCAGDVFMPHKIERQLTAMQDGGYVVSHTSYHVGASRDRLTLPTVHSGEFGGKVYPTILDECPIATATVMLHRLLAAEGFAFTRHFGPAEDILSWIWVAQRYEILGIDEPLAVIESLGTNSPGNWKRSVKQLEHVLKQLRADPVHVQYRSKIEALEQLRAQLVELGANDRAESGAAAFPA